MIKVLILLAIVSTALSGVQSADAYEKYFQETLPLVLEKYSEYLLQECDPHSYDVLSKVDLIAQSFDGGFVEGAASELKKLQNVLNEDFEKCRNNQNPF